MWNWGQLTADKAHHHPDKLQQLRARRMEPWSISPPNDRRNDVLKSHIKKSVHINESQNHLYGVKDPFDSSKKLTYDFNRPINTPKKSWAAILKRNVRFFGKSVWVNFEDYCGRSTLHGLRYIGDNSLSAIERIFWFISFVVVFSLAGLFIYQLLKKRDQTPVIITISPTYTKISEIPFPAITICNMNQAKREIAEGILKSRDPSDDIDKQLLNDTCNMNFSGDTERQTTEEMETAVANWTSFKKFMIRVTQPCAEMLQHCTWKGQKFSCEDLFNSVVTDEGICCGFNKVDRKFVFHNPTDQSDLNLTYPFLSLDWSPEKGYRNADGQNVDDIAQIPFRTRMAGSLSGLSLVLNANVSDYYCSTTTAKGFKAVLHNPVETPKLSEFGFFVSPGQETRVVIVPKLYESSTSIRSISPAKRQCWFGSERNLTYYRTYTQRNCELECESQLIYQHCRCVSYHLPRHPTMKVCDKNKDSCVQNAKALMERNATVSNGCNCMPGCFEVVYAKEQSTADIDETLLLKHEAYFLIVQAHDGSVRTFKENMAVVHFYFFEDQFEKFIKSELYGFSEFLSNIGGLLGLFMGFSFISAVEVVYYLSIRVYYQYMGRRHNLNAVNNKKNVLIPFMK